MELETAAECRQREKVKEQVSNGEEKEGSAKSCQWIIQIGPTQKPKFLGVQSIRILTSQDTAQKKNFSRVRIFVETGYPTKHFHPRGAGEFH